MLNELHLVHNLLQTITREMRQLNLRGDAEKPLCYELYLVFDKKVSNFVGSFRIANL